jgi:hypothetical protein
MICDKYRRKNIGPQGVNIQVVAPEPFLQGLLNKQGFLACNICV